MRERFIKNIGIRKKRNGPLKFWEPDSEQRAPRWECQALEQQRRWRSEIRDRSQRTLMQYLSITRLHLILFS